MKRRTRRSLVAIAVIALIVMAGWFFLTERPIAVQVVTIDRDVPVRIYGLGTVEARIVSRIGFEVGAALTGLEVDNGDAVARGQILARLHAAEQEARVARAAASAEAADATLGRTRANVVRARAVLAQREATNTRQQALAVRNTISAQRAEEAQRDVDVAAAELAVAESDIAVALAQRADAEAALRYEQALLDHHVLRAPFDAIVVDRHVEAGTVVRAGEPIFTLMDPTTVWTLAYVDEARAGAIALGQSAEVRLRSLPHEVFSGTVARIGSESDRCPPQVYLGEQAEVRITVALLTEAFLVPEIAVSGFDGHQGRVWVVRDEKLTEVSAVFGHRTEVARLEIVSGLAEGDQVVSAPAKGLSEGRMARVLGGGAS